MLGFLFVRIFEIKHMNAYFVYVSPLLLLQSHIFTSSVKVERYIFADGIFGCKIMLREKVYVW